MIVSKFSYSPLRVITFRHRAMKESFNTARTSAVTRMRSEASAGLYSV